MQSSPPIRTYSPQTRRVLARKYRPKALSDLIGQEVLVQSLTQSLTEKHIPQAILLHGIRGTGKTSTARILARTINCTQVNEKESNSPYPCGSCVSCKALDEDRHPDVIEMDAASHTGVDDIRELIDSAQYKAIVGRYKVFIIDEVHMLSKSAFNALLKTLEEPPAHVLFIFATTEINKIPDTILSRCARFDLKRVDSKTLIRHFQWITHQEAYEIETNALAILARASDGSVRDGLTLLDQAMNLTDIDHSKLITSRTLQSMLGTTDRQKLYQMIQSLLNKEVEKTIQEARQLLENGADALMIIQDLLECLYRIACFKLIPNLTTDETIPEFERTEATVIAQRIEEVKILSLWKMMLKGYEDIKQAPFSQQALEMVLLRLGFAAQLPPIDRLLNSSGSTEKTSNTAPIAFQPPIHNASIEKTAQTQVNIRTEEDLFQLLQKECEILLLSYLQKDFAFISFSSGNIAVQLKKEEASKRIPQLKQFLQKKTGIEWIIHEEKTDRVIQTPEEKRQNIQKQQQIEILNTPIIQKIQQDFPNSQIEFV